MRSCQRSAITEMMFRKTYSILNFESIERIWFDLIWFILIRIPIGLKFETFMLLSLLSLLPSPSPSSHHWYTMVDLLLLGLYVVSSQGCMLLVHRVRMFSLYSSLHTSCSCTCTCNSVSVSVSARISVSVCPSALVERGLALLYCAVGCHVMSDEIVLLVSITACNHYHYHACRLLILHSSPPLPFLFATHHISEFRHNITLTLTDPILTLALVLTPCCQPCEIKWWIKVCLPQFKNILCRVAPYCDYIFCRFDYSYKLLIFVCSCSTRTLPYRTCFPHSM